MTMRYGGDKIWYHCKSETKFMNYFTNGQTFSAQWSFTYAGNKLYLHKKLLPITNINLGKCVAVAEGTDSEAKCHFQQ